ncbi:unnamed protein product [Brassica oleracea var. botrytis]
MEVLDIYLAGSYGSVRIKVAITSVGCSRDGKESNRSLLNLTDSPFFTGRGNSLVSVGCNSKASLTNIEPSIVGCHLPDDSDTHQVIGVSIESINNGSQNSRVAFLTDEVYRSSEAIEPKRLYANECATISIGWVIQTKNLTFLDSLSCINTNEFNSLDYRSIQNKLQPNHPDGRVSSRNRRASETCINVPGDFNCVGDKTRAIMIGKSQNDSGFGILVLVAGILMLRKFIKKRRITQRKKKFFKRNGGLLLQQQLDTNKGILEKTRVFTSSELEKATEIFSENRILGQGGEGTVYKGMLVDGKTVSVKKSKAVDEDKLEEFINKVVILSQVNHRHVVKL